MMETKHTPGPAAWAIYIQGEPSDIFMHKQIGEAECVRRNALYPDPTRQFVPLYPDAQIVELTKQRDELLAALTQLATAIETATITCTSAQDYLRIATATGVARAAIACAKGGAV